MENNQFDPAKKELEELYKEDEQDVRVGRRMGFIAGFTLGSIVYLALCYGILTGHYKVNSLEELHPFMNFKHYSLISIGFVVFTFLCGKAGSYLTQWEPGDGDDG